MVSKACEFQNLQKEFQNLQKVIFFALLRLFFKNYVYLCKTMIT